MTGNCAPFKSCWRAASSSGTPLVQPLIGAPFSGLNTLKVASVIVFPFFQSPPAVTLWWLGTELNRVHWLFRPALCRRVPEPNLVDGARVELAFHGCRPWVIPLYEPPILGAR